MTPELHRPVRLERIGPTGLDVTVEATAAECSALAARFGVVALTQLFCRFSLRRATAGVIEASGQLHAHVTQTCVVSLEDFAADVSEEFRLHFVPEGSESDDPDPETTDEVPYSGDAIDLGEAAAEQLALTLDPYPRAPDASLSDPEVAEEPSTPNPFSGLAGFRDRLS